MRLGEKGARPRVAVVSSSAPPFGAGGVSSAHYNLFLALRRAGEDARLFTYQDWRRPDGDGILRRGFPRPPLDAISAGCDLWFRATAGRRGAYHLADILRTGPGALALRRPLRAYRPDAVVIPDHGAPALFLGRAAGAPVVLVVHHVPARFRAVPLLAPACEADVRAATALEQRALAAVDAVVCPSDYMARVFRETYAYDGSVTVLPNLVDEGLVAGIAQRDPRAALGLPPQAPLVYVPAAGSRIKGADLLPELLRGLAAATRAPLGFYLSGDLAPALRGALDALPGQVRVHAPGHLPYAENLALVKACSFALSPTLAESFGMALLEALLCGVPVVTFDVGACAEVVRPGDTGVLVPCPDAAALARAAAGLLDPGPLAQLRARLRATSLRAFGAEQVLAGWREVLAQARAGRRSTSPAAPR